MHTMYSTYLLDIERIGELWGFHKIMQKADELYLRAGDGNGWVPGFRSMSCDSRSSTFFIAIDEIHGSFSALQ